jgi:serine/threonine protein kinase
MAGANTTVQMFIAECELWHGCRHPTVIWLYGYDLARRIFVMEQAETSLDKVLEEGDYVSAANPEVSWDVTRKAIVVFGLACGLAWLHSGSQDRRDVVIHRDVKPANVLLDGDLHPKLCDFGLSGVLYWDWMQGQRAGTSQYLPPEVFGARGVDHYTPAVDVWGMGWVIAQIYGARAPVSAGDSAQAPPPRDDGLSGVPWGLKDILLMCFLPDPVCRIRAVEFAAACRDESMFPDINREEFMRYAADVTKEIPGLDPMAR